MSKSPDLQYIKHKHINSEKWNRCIDNAANCRVYAYDWHLDRTAIEWDALVWGDFEYVMPLPVRKKMGVKYIYQPLFCQQLGIFPSPSKEIANTFYIYISKNFKFSDVHINSENPIQKKEIIEFIPRKNYLLDLSYNYKSLRRSYSTNTKRNISKASKNNLQYIQGIRLEEYLAFKADNLIGSSSKKNIAKLKSIIAFSQYKGIGEIIGVYNHENILCAAAYFYRCKNRITYMNAVSTQLGKDLRGMHFLLDKFIQNNAEKNIHLDFEGSMIHGIARFYKGFGAIYETYFQLKFNRLPLPLRWIKR